VFGRLLKPSVVAYAHCDIPCGIYDPTPAKIAADTVAKMVEKIGALPKMGRTRPRAAISSA